jgi:hypothetical protein
METTDPFNGLRDDLARTFEAIARQGASVAAFSEAVTAQLDQIWTQLTEHGDAIVALSNRIQGLTDAAALRSELDDLRLEFMEVRGDVAALTPPEAA